MNTQIIDEAIDRYVSERMTGSRERASARFLSYAHLKYAGQDLVDFMRSAKGLTRYYIDMTRVFENPFRGREMAFLATMVVVAIFSCWLLHDDDTRLSGICILSGTIVNGATLLKYIAAKWSKSGVMIAIYEEIAALADQEGAATT
ncbi:MAG TPA: hypothetical protein VF795_02285 [Desulfuromonadaceae bacterium]